LRKDPALTLPAFLGREEAFYKVTVPNSPNFQLPGRYPWMVASMPNEKSAAWEISFARSGLPFRLTPSDKAVSGAELSYLKPSPIDARYLTRGNVSGRGQSARLTDNGKTLLRLLTFPD